MNVDSDGNRRRSHEGGNSSGDSNDEFDDKTAGVLELLDDDGLNRQSS